MRQQAAYHALIRNLIEAGDSAAPKTYFIETFGCQMNENDSEKLAGILETMGLRLAGDAWSADLILLNTCCIRENADDRFFGHLGALKPLAQDPGRIVGVCGCLVMQPESLARIRQSFPYTRLILGPQDLHRLPELLVRLIQDGQITTEPSREDMFAEGLPIRHARRYRALCSILYGCNNVCSYCVVPYVRGRERSREPDAVLNELRGLVDAGYREIMLLGQNVNSYAYGFADLLADAASIPGLYRLRFMTSHPKDLSNKLIRTIADHPNIERHLHLPLQSGSDAVLARMNRRYTRDHYLKLVQQARTAIDDLAITTDLIVGFPGETEADFEQTLDLMRQVRFDAAFTFLYSRREGTPAASAPDQVAPEIAQERFERLVALQNEHTLAANQARVGRVEEVLAEGESERQQQVFSGRNSRNQLINFTVEDQALLPETMRGASGTVFGDQLEGSILRVRVTGAKTFSLQGVLESFVL